jgi:hypothetical protein
MSVWQRLSLGYSVRSTLALALNNAQLGGKIRCLLAELIINYIFIESSNIFSHDFDAEYLGAVINAASYFAKSRMMNARGY